MPPAKYKQYFQLMMDQHADELAKFKKVHDGFAQDPDQWQKQFHDQGRDIKDLMHSWERRLCSGTERGNYARYSANLSEKFWEEIRKEYPLIDQVGLKTFTAKSRLKK